MADKNITGKIKMMAQKDIKLKIQMVAQKNITWKIQMMAQKDITWKIQMMAQKDITWKIQMMLLKFVTLLSLKRVTNENKKQKQENRVTQNMEERIKVLTSGEALRRMQNNVFECKRNMFCQ